MAALSAIGAAPYYWQQALNNEYETIARTCIQFYCDDTNSAFPKGLRTQIGTGEVAKIGDGNQAKVYHWIPNSNSSVRECAVRVRNIWNHNITDIPSSQREQRIEDSLRFSKFVPRIYHRIQKNHETAGTFAVIFMELIPELLSPPITSPLSFHEFQEFAKQSFQFLIDLKRAKVLHLDISRCNCSWSKAFQSVKYFDFGSSHHVGDELRREIVSRGARPPEIWLGLTELYGHSIDMWSMGCLFFIALKGAYLFQDFSNTNAFSLFSRYLGPPPESMIQACSTQGFDMDTLANHSSLLSDSILKSSTMDENNLDLSLILTSRTMSDLDMKRETYKNKGLELVDLIRRMLRYDPRERITPEDALRHPFFSNMQIERPVLPPQPSSSLTLGSFFSSSQQADPAFDNH